MVIFENSDLNSACEIIPLAAWQHRALVSIHFFLKYRTNIKSIKVVLEFKYRSNTRKRL